MCEKKTYETQQNKTAPAFITERSVALKAYIEVFYRRSSRVLGGAENARLENAGLELSGTGNLWNATCGIT